MGFQQEQLSKPQGPDSLASFNLPEDYSEQPDVSLKPIGEYTPSPIDWRDEVLYFLLPDRFSDEKERELLQRDPESIRNARPTTGSHSDWWWSDWALSGIDRYQGGTLKGIRKRLDYLKNLGITAIWIGPIFKQRGHLDTYHGYGVQDFLDIEPRFGNRQDLMELVKAAHQKGMRVILDIIFNHSGHNWDYSSLSTGGKTEKPDFRDWGSGYYQFGNWFNQKGEFLPPDTQTFGRDDAVWPQELRKEELYTKHGKGDLGAGDIDDPHAEHKISDFENLRDFYLDNTNVLNFLGQCYKYWIALTDVDGFRIDTLKHVTKDHARKFCGTIKEYAARLGKTRFLLIAEIGGGDYVENVYLNAVPRNLDAALDIGEMRSAIRRVAKGLDADGPSDFFSKFEINEHNRDFMPSHRFMGSKNVLILDDHDQISTEKERFSFKAPKYQELAGVALQLFCLGIPCIYYGTEQGFSGPEPEVVEKYLIGSNGWNDSLHGGDRYLREAMFGPEHPLKPGLAGRPSPDNVRQYDESLPGFGPFGTAGKECFDPTYFTYQKITEMNAVRRKYSTARYGRQYHRQISYLTYPFSLRTEAGQIVAWSRILDSEELLCILNSNGAQKRGARILVDKELNRVGSKIHLILNTTHTNYPSEIEVQQYEGIRFIEINDLDPSGFLIYANTKSPVG